MTNNQSPFDTGNIDTLLSKQSKKESKEPRTTKPMGSPKTPKKRSTERNITTNIDSNIVINITSNIVILQKDVERLRQPAYKPQTFRVGDKELEQIKDQSYQLSKEVKKK